MLPRVRSRVAFGLVACTTLLAQGAGATYDAPEGSGVVGGALVGAELVVLSELALGAEATWAYTLGAGLGGIAGGYVGWELEQRVHGEVSMLLMTTGFGLLIPTIVWVGNSLEEEPSEARIGNSRLLGPALVNLSEAGVTLGVPLVQVASVETPTGDTWSAKGAKMRISTTLVWARF